jgi:hypothetical protein
MRKKILVAFGGVAGALLISISLFAHHGGSMYDWQNPVTLTGTVTAYQFVNPHTQIRFEVTDEKGTVTEWVAETVPVQKLLRAGWNAKTLKPGDQISVTGAPNREGKKELGVVKLVGPAGQVLGQGIE